MKNPTKTYMFGRNEIFIVFLLLVFTSLLLFSVGVMIGKRLLENECKLILEDEQKKVELCQKDLESKNKLGSLPPTTNPQTAGATAPAGTVPQAVAVPTKTAETTTDKKETKPVLPAQIKKELLKEPVKPEPQKVEVKKAEPQKMETTKTEPTEADPSHLGIKEITSDIKGKYTVQVGSYKDELEAQQLAYSLYNMGYKRAYYIETELPNKGVWYRVGISFFDKKASADLFGEMLRKQNKINNYIVRKVE